MSDRPITRRRLLAAAGGLALPLALAPLRPWSALVTVAPANRAGRLAGLLADPASATAVGRVYLDSVPGEADPRILVSRVSASLGPRGGTVDDDELRRLLARRIARDFEDERISTVQGWVLSVTELRLCALCALSA
jgi:hypothetical protein